ncbi:TPA: hypothetical protein I8Y22_004294 [Raoultella planticola]|nr:hypothetical protein [Raoultella planticola]
MPHEKSVIFFTVPVALVKALRARLHLCIYFRRLSASLLRIGSNGATALEIVTGL